MNGVLIGGGLVLLAVGLGFVGIKVAEATKEAKRANETLSRAETFIESSGFGNAVSGIGDFAARLGL